MDSNNVLRLALMLSSTQTHTFKKNLNKLIKLVLFDSYSSPMNIMAIINNINDVFSLSFTDAEIIAAIKDDSNIVIHEKDDPVNNLYEITPEEYKKISLYQSVNIDIYLTEFLNIRTDFLEISFETAKELLYKFIYITFNSDTQTLLELMDKKCTDSKKYCIANEFNSSEAEFINEFLNWDYKPKNEFILNLISACFDYCMLTVKKDNNSYSSVFNGKIFYLDSNIIFRLAGFNKVERQSVLNSFIKKCSEANIKICYTNHTNSEIKNTIKYHVDSLKKLLNKNYPLSIKAMKAMSSKYANLDFYEKYVEWCKSNPLAVGDFNAFQLYLETEIQKVIFSFKLEVFEDFDTTKNHQRFTELSDDFNKYKTERYKNTFEGAIKTDINNYLYMIEKNGTVQVDNFMQLKYYFITADHCLTEWSSLKRPGTIPMFVLPSVWYSILLKYKGRTNNDYNAFCQFLNIRIVPEKDIHLNDKREMLAYILTLNEESDIKERIIFDIETRLSNVETEIEDPIAFAEESHQTILQEKLLEQRAEINKESEKNIRLVREQMESSHKIEIERLKLEEDKAIQKEHKAGYCEGEKNIIEKEANRIIKKNKKWLTALDVFSIVLLCFFGLSLILLLALKGEVSNNFTIWYNENSATISIITILLSAVSNIIKRILVRKAVLSTEKDKIIAKLIDRYHK